MTPGPAAIIAPTTEAAPHLLRRVGLFDAIMIVMGGIVGAGIFINRYVVARQVHMPVLILAVRVAGGVVAMLGAFAYAELAARMPNVGGQYAYLRDAFHPVAVGSVASDPDRRHGCSNGDICPLVSAARRMADFGAYGRGTDDRSVDGC